MESQWARIFADLTFKSANDLERSESIVRRKELYLFELGKRDTDEVDETASHLVAINGEGRVVSGMRIMLERPLEIERHLDLSVTEDQNEKIAQIGGFWADNQWRAIGQNRFLQIGMLKLAFMFGRANEIGQFFTYALPRMVPLYRAALFENLSLTFAHPVWGEVNVLRLDLDDLAARSSAPRTSVTRLLAARDLKNFIL